jgi:hypothetical protein
MKAELSHPSSFRFHTFVYWERKMVTSVAANKELTRRDFLGWLWGVAFVGLLGQTAVALFQFSSRVSILARSAARSSRRLRNLSQAP